MTFVAEKDAENAIHLTRQRLQRAFGVGGISTKQRDGATHLATLYQEGCAKIRLPNTQSPALEAVLINTAVGVRNIPQDYRNVARILQLNQVEFFFKIMIPAAAPYIFTGLRIGVGLSWLAIIAAEMLIGGVGIGFFIWDAWNASNLSDIIVALIYVGLVGFVLDRIMAFAGRAVTRGTTEQ